MLKREYSTRAAALAALKRRCRTLSPGATSGTWAFVTLWVVGSVLYAQSTCHTEDTVKKLLWHGPQAANQDLPNG